MQGPEEAMNESSKWTKEQINEWKNYKENKKKKTMNE